MPAKRSHATSNNSREQKRGSWATSEQAGGAGAEAGGDRGRGGSEHTRDRGLGWSDHEHDRERDRELGGGDRTLGGGEDHPPWSSGEGSCFTTGPGADEDRGEARVQT